MMSQTDKEIVRGAIILTYAGLLSKVLSAFYRIPLQNITGDVGFYIYQQIYPFIGMMSMLMLYGLPQSIATLLIDQPSFKREKKKMRYFLYSVAVSLFVCLFALAPVFSRWMGDPALVSGLRVSFLLLFILPELALERGFDQSEGRIDRTAISQVLEQLFRVSVIIIGAVMIMRLQQSLYTVGVIAGVGALIGGSVALSYFYIRNKKQVERIDVPALSTTPFSYVMLVKPLFLYSVMIAMNHMVLLLLQWVDAFTLVALLRESGTSLNDAQTLKGILDRAQPLSQLGIVASSSITLALVPGLTKATKRQDHKQMAQLAGTAYRFGLYLSSAAVVGLVLLMQKVNLVLFKDTAGTISLQIFVIAILFTSLAIITSSILQAYGEGRLVVIGIITGLGMKYLTNQLLVPYFFLSGAAVSTVLSTLVIFCFNRQLLKKHVPQGLGAPIGKLIIALVGMAVVVFGMDILLSSWFFSDQRMLQFIYLLSLIILGIITFGTLLIKTGAISKEEQALLLKEK